MNFSAIYWCIRKGFPIRSLWTCDLCYYKLPASTHISHPYGITVANGAEIGENVFISPNVTIGVSTIRYNKSGWDPGDSQSAKIGNRVFIGAGTVILGDITIADDCIIGAGSIVISSFPEPGSIIVGSPAKRIR